MVSMPLFTPGTYWECLNPAGGEKNFLEHLGFVVKVNVNVITSGDISTAILTEAGCENILSIIIGSRGRGRVKGLLLGSVSADILRNGKTHLFDFPAQPYRGA
jgi:hypothetical protein